MKFLLFLIIFILSVIVLDFLIFDFVIPRFFPSADAVVKGIEASVLSKMTDKDDD